ncbi:hypothetical protein L208DRAFT_997725, partial [Tricholoma matsutake]
RTDCIIDWLMNNVNDCILLFSNNMQDASAEGRRLKTGKSSKMVYYCKIAVAVFTNDPDKKGNYAQDPERYAKSVENHIRGLKQKYCEFNKALDQTGAGLRAEEIQEGMDLHNLVSESTSPKPCFSLYQHDRLHGFWRTVPSFNLHTQSAEHGQNLAAQAQQFL